MTTDFRNYATDSGNVRIDRSRLTPEHRTQLDHLAAQGMGVIPTQALAGIMDDYTGDIFELLLDDRAIPAPDGTDVEAPDYDALLGDVYSMVALAFQTAQATGRDVRQILMKMMRDSSEAFKALAVKVRDQAIHAANSAETASHLQGGFAIAGSAVGLAASGVGANQLRKSFGANAAQGKAQTEMDALKKQQGGSLDALSKRLDTARSDQHGATKALTRGRSELGALRKDKADLEAGTRRLEADRNELFPHDRPTPEGVRDWDGMTNRIKANKTAIDNKTALIKAKEAEVQQAEFRKGDADLKLKNVERDVQVTHRRSKMQADEKVEVLQRTVKDRDDYANRNLNKSRTVTGFTPVITALSQGVGGVWGAGSSADAAHQTASSDYDRAMQTVVSTSLEQETAFASAFGEAISSARSTEGQVAQMVIQGNAAWARNLA